MGGGLRVRLSYVRTPQRAGISKRVVRFLLNPTDSQERPNAFQPLGIAVMSRAKSIDRPRHSIFEDLGEKYPELGKKGPERPPRPKRSRLWIGMILGVLLGGLGLGLSTRYGDTSPDPPEARGDVLTATMEPRDEPPQRVEAQAPLPARAPIEQAEVPAPEPVPLAPRPALSEDVATPPLPEEAASSSPVEEPTPCEDLRGPSKLSGSGPEYPEAARQAFQEGTVIVEAQIDATGQVERVRTLRGAAPELDRAALAAVANWRFEPATCAGKKVTGFYRTALHFNLTPPQENSQPAVPQPAVPQPAVPQPVVPQSVVPPTVDHVEPPVRLFAPPPEYPPTEWVAAVEGDVMLKATIDEAGLVVAIEIVQSVSPGLDAAAAKALERWIFQPARRGGDAVSFQQVVTFRFRR